MPYSLGKSFFPPVSAADATLQECPSSTGCPTLS
jgi:hypothetical protein